MLRSLTLFHSRRQCRPLRSARRLPLLFVVTGLVAVTGMGGCGGSDGPAWDQSGYRSVNLALQPLRRDFESYYGQVRIVAVVAPTCGTCLENSERFYNAVGSWAEANDAEIFVVWGSVLPTDTEIRCADRVKSLQSPRIHHYWDNSGRATRAFGRMLQMPSNGSAYDVYFAYSETATWDPQDTMDEEPDDFSVALSLWEPTRPDIAALSGDIRRVVLPEFSGAEMVRILDEYVSSRSPR